MTMDDKDRKEANQDTMKNRKKAVQRTKRLCFSGIFLLGFLLCVWGLTGCRSQEAEFFSMEEDEAEEGEQHTEEAFPEGKSAGETQEPIENPGSAAKSQDSSERELSPKIYVDVCGAVVSPGVYELDADSRVFQAIEAAGGFLPEAAGDYVNRAESMRDGQKIYVPTKEEAEKKASGNPGAVPGEGLPGSLSESGTQDAKVNLNTADENQLTTLTGIGATRAKAIIAYRTEHGPFAAAEEIMNVEGIKEGTFSKIKDKIVV